MDLISVIVPVYKVEEYLDRCVQSIVDQTYTNLEIILVDDGSPDRCPQMCDEWAKKDTRVRVIHKENGGLSDARNAGMAVAKGEYIAFVDSDDWVELEFIQNLLSVMIKHGCDVAGCLYCKCLKKVEEDEASTAWAVQVFDRTAAMSELIVDRAIEQVVWNKLYKRGLIEDISFEKGKYHEDEFWSYQVIGRIGCMAMTNYVGYNYFQRMDSIMGEDYSLKRLDAVEAKVQRQIYLQENMPELADLGQVNLYFTCIYQGQQMLKHIKGLECREAFRWLKRTSDTWRLSKAQKQTLKTTHRIWAKMAECSLYLTCWMRNLLSIGL